MFLKTLRAFWDIKKISKYLQMFSTFFPKFYDEVLILFCVNFPVQRFPLWLIESLNKDDGNGKDNAENNDLIGCLNEWGKIIVLRVQHAP